MRLRHALVAVPIAAVLVAVRPWGSIPAGGGLRSAEDPWRFVLLAVSLPSVIGCVTCLVADGHPGPSPAVVLAVLIVTYALRLPPTMRRLLWRARRDAAEHEDVLTPN